jgi:hypothetical protein
VTLTGMMPMFSSIIERSENHFFDQAPRRGRPMQKATTSFH